MVKQTVKIFIASSSEMKEERDKCIIILNEINKSHQHLHLEAIEWEYDIVHGNHPNFKDLQKAINPLLKAADVCIFIFNAKIGKYTREEFELAKKLKKKLIPFFKVGFSAKTKDENTNWGELIDFKVSLDGFISAIDFNDSTKFELELKDNLHLYLSQQFSQYSSQDVSALLRLLNELHEEIDLLKRSQKLLNTTPLEQNLLLEKEKEKLSLLNELNQSKEIQEQQAKDKKELELRLEPQIVKDNLKQKALAAIKENKFDDAKALLLESAKDSVIETATTFYELGKVAKLQLSYKEALKYFELAVNIKPGDLNMIMEAANMYHELANYDKAISYYEKLLDLLNENDKADLSFVNNELGIVNNKVGDYDKAIFFLKESIKINEELYNDENPELAKRYNNLGTVYSNKKDYETAIEYVKKALNIDLKYYDNEHPNIADYYNNLGVIYSNKEEYDNAIYYLEKTIAIDKKHFGEKHPKIAIDYNNFGAAYYGKNELDKAIDYYEMALHIDKEYFGEEHPKISLRYANLGWAYYYKEEYQKAIDYFEVSIKIDKKFFPANHSRIVKKEESVSVVQQALKNQQNNP